MKLTHKQSAALAKTPFVAVLATKEKSGELPAGIKVPAAFTKAFKGGVREQASTFATGGPAERVLLVGLGATKELNAEKVRRAAALAVRAAERADAPRMTLVVSDRIAQALDPATVACAAAEGARMGAYRYRAGKSKSDPAKLKSVAIMGSGAPFKRGVRRGQVLAEANCFTRDLQNKPGNQMTPRLMAAEAKKLATRSTRITCKVLDEKQMAALGMNMLLSVSRGAGEPARLIHLTYKPKTKAKGRVALVGKGLTFDAGGISIKPSAKMDEMRFDMSGGAAVLGAFHALAGIDVPYEVHGVVPSSENIPDGSSTKPGDIFKAMNGKTVEVLNTDAEGRLILGDALCYVEKKVKPDTIIDLATLTGAVIVGLGHELSGMFASTDKLRDELTAAGEATGERVWPLPLLDLHKRAMRGVVADLRNIGGGEVGAGSTQGAAFLSAFVDEQTEWCHLDIAGTAWNTAQRDWVGGAQGSGVGTRLLIDYLEMRRTR